MRLEEWHRQVRGYVRTLKAAARRLGSVVEVGWPDGAREKPSPRNAAKAAKLKRIRNPGPEEAASLKAMQGPTLATVAKTLCHGRAKGAKYPAIPARDFVKVMEESHSAPILKVAAKAVTGGASLAAVGVAAKGALQRAIRDSDRYEPLAPSTVARRRGGSSRPLIDTGTLVNSVGYDIKAK